MSITVAADPKIGKSGHMHTPSALAGPPSPAERIGTARDSFLGRPIPAGLSSLDREYLRGDQNSTALAALLGYLGALARRGGLTPETVAEAVEYAVETGLAATDAVPGLIEVSA